MVLKIVSWILIFVSTYFAASFIQTIFHRIFGHKRRISKLYEVHVGGHHAQYSKNLLSEKWIPTEQHITWYYAIPFVPMVTIAFCILRFDLFASHLLGLAFAIWWHIYLHRHYHIQNSRFERFKWFKKKQRLHFLHHHYPHKNYAIVEYFWDYIFGTYKKI